MSNIDLENLITRLGDHTPNIKTISTPHGDIQVKTSSGSVRSNAMHQVRELRDLSLVPEFQNLLVQTKHKRKRRWIYYILGHIGKNTNDPSITRILLDRLPLENDKEVLDQILRMLGEQFTLQDVSPFLPYVVHTSSTLRHSAIKALRICTDPRAEDVLLKILNDTEDEYDRQYALSSLFGVGTNRSVPQLKEMFPRFTGETKATALGLLSKLADHSLLPLFVNALSDKSQYVKWAAMSEIIKHGSEDAIEGVIKRVKVILSRQRKVEMLPKSDLIEALDFLYRYWKTNDSIRKLFQWIQTKKMDFLFDKEKEQLNRLLVNGEIETDR